MTRTPWYPASVNPVRVGLYEVKFVLDRRPILRRWNGERWTMRHTDMPTIFGQHRLDKWRGLAQPSDRRGK